MEQEEESEIIKIDSLSKEQENETYPLKKKENLENIRDGIQINDENLKHRKIFFIKLIISFLFVLLIFLIIFLIVNWDSKKNHKKGNLKKRISTNNNTNNYNKTNINLDNEKINVGFLYSTLSGNGIAHFMVVTAENFIKSGKYNVFFFTNPRTNKELNYSSKIKRIYANQNSTLLKKACKQEKIDFLIVNNVFSSKTIRFYKSFGVKIVGIYHGVFISSMFNNITSIYRSWINLEDYDAFIHISADDYYYYSGLGFKRNIFIPNLYTFEPSKTPSSNLSDHNIMMLGRLNDKKKGLIYALKAMNIIIKEIPDAKLLLVSSDSKSRELINNLKINNLTNNVRFISFTPKIEEFFLKSSVFLFTSLTEAFPMALNEAKAYGLPCVTFDVSYSYPYKSGVIKVEHFDYKALAREVIKLLKDYNYRIKIFLLKPKPL